MAQEIHTLLQPGTCSSALSVVLLLQPTHLRATDEDFYSLLSHSLSPNDTRAELVPFEPSCQEGAAVMGTRADMEVAGHNGPIIHSTHTCPTPGENPLNHVKTF